MSLLEYLLFSLWDSEARTFELRASSGYLTPSNGYVGFPYNPLVRPKKHGTACDIGPKGEARTHRTACAIGPKGEARTVDPRAPSVPKAKLGHSDRVRHRSQRRT